MCNQPTYINVDGNQFPGNKEGNPVNNLSLGIKSLYNQARSSLAVNVFTGSMMLCRKIIMNIAVEHNAPENKKFAEYVEYLFDEHYIPINAKPWVDKIRIAGNQANHKIEDVTKDEATDIIKFTEMLLKNLYEFIEPETT